jgi:hypothetical protein
VTQDQSKPENCRERYYPPEQSRPKIKARRQK